MTPLMHHGSRRATLARLALGAIALPASGVLLGCDQARSLLGRTDDFRGIDVTGADYGKDFRLHDADGRLRTLADFRGQVVQLYFGFTQCPDVCPTALSRAVEAKRLLGADGARFQVVFVSVDPERDRPELLREYMAAFDPRFVALRPSPDELKQTAADFKIYYQAVPTGSGYTMDHSAQSYLFDTQGRLRLVLRHEQGAADYAYDIKRLLHASPDA